MLKSNFFHRGPGEISRGLEEWPGVLLFKIGNYSRAYSSFKYVDTGVQ